MSEGHRYAILIGSCEFPEYPSLSPLRCPKNDAEGLAAVLTSSDFGLFTEQQVFVNEPHGSVARAVNRTFKAARWQDQILVYYSGHGILDNEGHLHLAMTDTEVDALEATAMPVEFLRKLFNNHRCKRVAIILDCCYSGAVSKDLLKSGVNDQLQLMRGIYILTASTAAQPAREKDGDRYSLLTKHIINGISQGEADGDNDGFVSMDDLFNYVTARVPQEAPQYPTKYELDVRGHRLFIARSFSAVSSPTIAPKSPTVRESEASFTENLKGVALTMILVPGGKFKMGSPEGEGDEDERPEREVTVPGFYIGKYEITQAQWEAVMGNDPSYFKGDRNLPVENVSWHDAKEFCKKITQMTDKEYRLPSEAEWEYACRAGTTGTSAGTLDGMAWYDSNSEGNTHPVGEKEPNAYGLYDMLGNVSEWCEDVWNGNYESAPRDGSAWLDGDSRAHTLRGGSWDKPGWVCRSTFRGLGGEDGRGYAVGFRVVVAARAK
jgi:formylglycine-generating enzyme required for sulfatase activity